MSISFTGRQAGRRDGDFIAETEWRGKRRAVRLVLNATQPKDAINSTECRSLRYFVPSADAQGWRHSRRPDCAKMTNLRVNARLSGGRSSLES